MKRLLICVLAIAMMLSSVAFANESANVNYEGKIDRNDATAITVIKADALKVEALKNNASAIELVSDPKGVNGKVVKVTNPAYVSSNVSGAGINSYFQDNVDTNASGNTITGVKNNISYGFSFYAPAAVENQTSDVYFNVNLVYATPTSNNVTVSLFQVKSGKIYSYAERNLNDKPGAKDITDGWHNLRFDFNLEGRSVKTYIDDVLFYNTLFSDDAVNYLRRIAVATTVDSTCLKIQEAYFDNFFVNETPECLFEGAIKEIDYGTCYIDDDFSQNASTKINSPGQGSEGCSVEQLRDSDEVIKVTIAKDATALPSFGSKAVSPAEGKDGHIPYKNEEYIFEMDVNFGDFNSDTKLLSFLKYNLDTKNTDLTTNSCMTIENGGVFKVGTSTDSMKYIAKLEKNKWYNFKFHYKPYNVVGGKNNGLMVDVYFMNELVGENLIVSKTTDKHIGTIRNANVQPGLAPTDKARVIYFDNLKFYQVDKVEINPVQIIDVEVGNALGDLISSTYDAGAKTITAYVSATSALKGGSVTLVAARYSATGELIEVKAVPAGAITKDTLTKVTANLNAADAQAGEEIKVMIVDSTNTLKPYIKPVTLSSSIQ